MKFFSSMPSALRARYALAAVAGLVLAAAFPGAGVAGLGWVAPGLMLAAACGTAPGNAFRMGVASGLFCHLASYYWLLLIPFPAGAWLGWLALSCYLSLFTGFWVWACWRLFPAQPTTETEDRRATLSFFLSSNGLQRAVWALLCAALWVALEMARGRLLTGFPWNFLGASQYEVLPVIQIASWTGIYGVSFLMVWFSVSLMGAAAVILSRPALNRVWLGEMLLPMGALVAVVIFGFQQISRPERPERTLKAALVQPSIPQTLIFDPAENTNRFNQLIELTERALAAKPDLLVWPEAAVPNLLRYEPDMYEAVERLTRSNSVWMVLGADDAIEREPEGEERKFDFYNSSFLISPEGEIHAGYQKRKLVIFGEYVPFTRWLPFLKHLFPAGEGFARGSKPVPFPIGKPQSVTSVLICFEDVFPHVAREYVQEDTDFLLNLTNNGWFGESAAQWQHAASAVFRAVENRIPLVRCANNGLTCWVDSRGAMREVYFPGTTDIYSAGYKIVEVPLLPEGRKRTLTFYTRHGDVFGWGCVAASALALAPAAAGALQRRLRRAAPPPAAETDV